MRLRLDATPEELKDKGPELVKALANEVKDANPELAHNLEKALPKKEPALKYKALRDLHQGNRKVYRTTLDSMVDGIQDILENPKLQKAKISKEAVLYLHVLNTQYECKDCNMFIADKDRCTVHKPNEVIRAHGSCGLYHPGKPMEGAEPHGKYTRQDTGYAENEHKQGFSCKRCLHFGPEVKDCAIVDKDSPGDDKGIIHPDGCCNAHELHPERAKLPTVEPTEKSASIIPESAAVPGVQVGLDWQEYPLKPQHAIHRAAVLHMPESFQKASIEMAISDGRFVTGADAMSWYNGWLKTIKPPANRMDDEYGWDPVRLWWDESGHPVYWYVVGTAGEDSLVLESEATVIQWGNQYYAHYAATRGELVAEDIVQLGGLPPGEPPKLPPSTPEAQYIVETRQLQKALPFLDLPYSGDMSDDDLLERERMRKADPPEPPEPEETPPGEEPPDPDIDEETGDPIIDPTTGLTPSEEEEARAAGELDEDEDEEEEAEKAALVGTGGTSASAQPMQLSMSDAQFIKAWGKPTLVKGRKTKKNPHGGPFMGPRGGLWADPDHKIHWDPDKHGKTPVKIARMAEEKAQDDGTRHDGAKLDAALIAMGDGLHDAQAANPMEQDATGFSRNDMDNWQYARGNTHKMQKLLGKYKRQLMGSEYWKAGLGDQIADLTVKFEMHPRFGSLNIHIDGYIKNRGDWVSQHNMHKELGMWKDRASGAYVLKDPEGFDFEAYEKKLKEALPDLTLTMGEPPRILNVEEKEAQKEERRQEMKATLAASASPVDTVWNGLATGDITNAVGVRWHEDEGTFEFRFPRGKVSTLFSNKRGGLPTVTWWDQSTTPWAVRVFDVDTACLAIQRIKDLYPDWEMATEGLEEAIKARDSQRAKSEVPIPEVAEHLAPGFELFPYQNEGVRFLLNSIDPEKKGGAMLGDEMGLGKTVQVLSYAMVRDQKMVVVCPKTVRRTWLQEANKFFPEKFVGKELDSAELLKVKRKLDKATGKGDKDDPWDLERFKGATPENIVKALGLDKANLATINYESLAKFEDVLKAAGFKIMAVDESHRAKNPKAKLTQAINSLGETVTTRILMSGTGVKKKKEEFATQFEIIRPGLFKKIEVRDKFGKRHMVTEIKRKQIGELWHRMRPFYLARQKDMVLKDLPPKTLQISTHDIATAPDLPYDAKSVINNARYFAYAEARDEGDTHETALVVGEEASEQMAVSLDSLREEFESGQTRLQVEKEELGGRVITWGEVLKDFGLRQLSAGGEVAGAYSKVKTALAQAKTQATKQLVDEILEGSDSNVLIFTNSKAAVRELKRIYGDNAVTHYGPDSHEKREKAKALFHPDTRPEGEDTPRILIGTMDTLKEGATLTSADKVVFNDLPWTASEFRQAEARAHRPGQDKPVDVYWVTAEGNQMDIAITTLLKYKVDLTKKINEGRRLSEDEQTALDTDITLDSILSEMRGAPTTPEKRSERETIDTPAGERTVTVTKPPEVISQEPVKKLPKKSAAQKAKDVDKPAPPQKAPKESHDIPETKPATPEPAGPSVSETNAKAAPALLTMPKEVKGLMTALHRLESRGEVAQKNVTPGLLKQVKAFMAEHDKSGIAGGEIMQWGTKGVSYDSPAGSLMLHPDPVGRKPYVSYTSQTTRVWEGAPAPEVSLPPKEAGAPSIKQTPAKEGVIKQQPTKGAQLKLFKALWLAGYDQDDSDAILERLVDEGPFTDDLGVEYADPNYHVPWAEGLEESFQNEEIAGMVIAGDVIGTTDEMYKATKPLDEPLAFDPTADINDREQQLYERVQGLMKRRLEDPPTDDDFDTPGGRFYGWSTNELLTHLRAQRSE